LEGHIVRGYDGDLMHLRLRVLEMGGLAIDQVQRAVTSLAGASHHGAREVLARSEQVVALARSIEDDIVALIARRQPVASDLRAIITVGKVSVELEHVGSGARKIARLGADLHAAAGEGAPVGHFHRDIRKIARLATGMLRDALDCFDRVDLSGAAEVVRRDAEIDGEFQLALRDLVTYAMEDPRWLRSALQTVFVMKALERIGDHARNIAAAVPRLYRAEDAGLSVPAERTNRPVAP
jgi:phosphate transport system protein